MAPCGLLSGDPDIERILLNNETIAVNQVAPFPCAFTAFRRPFTAIRCLCLTVHCPFTAFPWLFLDLFLTFPWPFTALSLPLLDLPKPSAANHQDPWTLPAFRISKPKCNGEQ